MPVEDFIKYVCMPPRSHSQSLGLLWALVWRCHLLVWSSAVSPLPVVPLPLLLSQCSSEEIHISLFSLFGLLLTANVRVFHTHSLFSKWVSATLGMNDKAVCHSNTYKDLGSIL